MRTRRLIKQGQVGSRLSLTLPGAGTSGYVWTVSTPPDDRWRMIKRETRPGSAFGAAETHGIELELLRPGTFTITAELKRPWESQALKQTEITVTVDTP